MHRVRIQGFSFIELLTTLAIVAILASITVPSFSGLVAKSRRSDAVSALLSVQLAQERWRGEHAGYAGDLAALGPLPDTSPDGHYALRVLRASGSDFLVVAQPQGVQRDDRCGRFALDARGPHHAGGFAGRRCWNR